MNSQIKKWIFRLAIAIVFIITLLIVIILNPTLSYAKSTKHNNLTIYHNKPLDPNLEGELDNAVNLLKASELYNPKMHLDICLNDGSHYPNFIREIWSTAFGWGFYNKVVLYGDANFKDNYVDLNGYRWNLTQLLAHEMTHCFQFDKFGLFKSKPLANIPNWKWEGYAEYVSRQNADQKDLTKNISRLLETNSSSWAIFFADQTIVARQYYDYWILVQYCMDVKQLNYNQVLADTTKEETLRTEMMLWYGGKK